MASLLGGLSFGTGALGEGLEAGALRDLHQSLSHPGQLHDGGLPWNPCENFTPAAFPGVNDGVGVVPLPPGFQPQPIQKRLEPGGVDPLRSGSTYFSDHNIKRLLLSKDTRFPTHGLRNPGGGPALSRRPNDGLGMEVVGGRELPGSGGTLCAYVGSVTKGGQLETLGEVKVGDEILEWNGTVLRGKTAEEVARVVANSTGEIEVLIRSGAKLDIGAGPSYGGGTIQQHQPHEPSQPSYGQQQLERSQPYGLQEDWDPQQGPYRARGQYRDTQGQRRSQHPYHADDVPTRDPGWSAPPVPPHNERQRTVSPSSQRQSAHAAQHQLPPPSIKVRPPTAFNDYDTVNSGYGSLRVAVSFDKATGTLFACVLAGRDLRLRAEGSAEELPNPFVKIYLLPGRSVEKKRRTKYVRGTTSPEWNQTVVYKDLCFSDLSQMWLELSVWDYNKSAQNEFLGQLVLPLADAAMVSGEPRWFALEMRSSESRNPYTGQAESAAAVLPASADFRREPMPPQQSYMDDPRLYDPIDAVQYHQPMVSQAPPMISEAEMMAVGGPVYESVPPPLPPHRQPFPPYPPEPLWDEMPQEIY